MFASHWHSHPVNVWRSPAGVPCAALALWPVIPPPCGCGWSEYRTSTDALLHSCELLDVPTLHFQPGCWLQHLQAQAQAVPARLPPHAQAVLLARTRGPACLTDWAYALWGPCCPRSATELSKLDGVAQTHTRAWHWHWIIHPCGFVQVVEDIGNHGCVLMLALVPVMWHLVVVYCYVFLVEWMCTTAWRTAHVAPISSCVHQHTFMAADSFMKGRLTLSSYIYCWLHHNTPHHTTQGCHV